MKVGLYIEDQGFSNKNLTSPLDGNPGVGGTWYEFVLLAYYLSKDEIVVVYHHSSNNYPNNCVDRIIDSHEHLLKTCIEDNIDLLIFKTNKNETWYKLVEKYKVNCIAWSHTFLSYPERKIIEKSNYIKRMICVGREHYDLYIDEDVIKKTAYIYNMVVDTEKTRRNLNYDNNVTYIGSIIPAKSFHVLAKVWKDVVAEVPDAKLHVIGSGKLYQENSKLGLYGIADEKYEKTFIDYITDSEGKLLPSVHFHGIMGKEKNNLISNTAVGVVNPTTKSETFCISAVEFEECGVPVCAGRKNGLLDTVSHNKTGLLSLSNKELKKNIVFLLTHREQNIKMGVQAQEFCLKFSPEHLVDVWKKELINSLNGNVNNYSRPEGNFFYNGKWIRMIIRYLRMNCKLGFIPSMGAMQYYSKESIKRIIRR